MNDEQVDKLIAELAATRKSLDAAVTTIRWNKVNTIIQYVLIVLVFIIGAVGIGYYFDQRHEDCVRGNETREAINKRVDASAAAVGVAIATLGDIPQETVDQYVELYRITVEPTVLQPRSC